MKKLVFSVVAITILNILPLVNKPELLLNYKMIIVILEGFCLWLTQPSFSVAETKANKNTDKFSILFILFASSISVVLAETEWAYFGTSSSYPKLLTIIGLVMIFCGIALRVWSIITLGRHFTATVRVNQQHELIKSGPYAIVRHPSYTGAFLAITGVAFFLNAEVSIIISVVLMFLAYYIRIRKEEALLISYFGNKYIVYTKNKKRLFPYVW